MWIHHDISGQPRGRKCSLQELQDLTGSHCSESSPLPFVKLHRATWSVGSKGSRGVVGFKIKMLKPLILAPKVKSTLSMLWALLQYLLTTTMTGQITIMFSNRHSEHHDTFQRHHLKNWVILHHIFRRKPSKMRLIAVVNTGNTTSSEQNHLKQPNCAMDPDRKLPQKLCRFPSPDSRGKAPAQGTSQCTAGVAGANLWAKASPHGRRGSFHTSSA